MTVVCNVSLVIFDKNSCKIFLNNSLNYGSFYTKDNINQTSLTLFVLPWENWVMKEKVFMELSKQIMRFLQASTTQNFPVQETTFINYYFENYSKDTLIYILRKKS